MTSAHRYQAQWQDLVFNGHLDDSGITDDPDHVDTQMVSYLALTRFDLSHVETTDYRELRQWLEGAEPNEAFEGVMLAVGDGMIVASSVADLEDRSALLRSRFSAAAVRIAAMNEDPVGVLPFKFKRATDGGSLALQVYGRPSSGRPVISAQRDEGLTRRFRFILACFDARLYSQTEHSISCATTGITTLTNAGDLYTHPTFTVVTTGGSSTITITIGASAQNTVTFAAVPAGTWTLDTRRSTITKADGTNGMQYRTAGFLSSLFLLPGANAVDLTGSSGLTSVTAAFRDAYA